MDNLAILQARMSSTRLPGKVMKEINGRPMIFWQISRILKSNVDGLILATSSEKSDDPLCEYVESIGIKIQRGSMDDVFSRFFNIVEKYQPKKILRLTGDCPLVMPQLINRIIDEFDRVHCDFMSNTNPPTFPDGLDIEIATSEALRRLSQFNLTSIEKEHVTLGFYERPDQFLFNNFLSTPDYSQQRWTVDYPEDLEFVRSVFAHFSGKETDFTFEDVNEVVKSKQIKDNVLGQNYRNISLSINELKGD